ncbi:AMP-binding protein [Rhizobiales bacterium RZME27]|uniref:AMP-binding protein n=1 Tax=Endobacterium cereale TaxID=2663029 RepID=A0A6A8A3G1_9HYPH|nr:AMP-binding protein [Endobacterium cereale]MEB2844611.1 AMP-binding protein [Endobacterium cereale]MQY45074.1 AMP-binding protein [Endobacterium cereale]
MGITGYLKNSLAENFVRRVPVLYPYLMDLLARSESMSLEERRQLRDQLTVRTLKQAGRTRYGRRTGAARTYGEWAILEKEALREDNAAFSARGFLPAHPAATGGTTGVPLMLRRSVQSVVFEQAVIDHLVQRSSGLDWKKARIAVLRGDTFKDPADMRTPHWVLRHGGLHLACSSVHLSPATIQDFMTAIRNFSPQVLWVYPSALEAFVRLGAEFGEHSGLSDLKVVFSSSEVLDPAVRQEASRFLDVPVLDFYGQSERVCASWNLNGGEHYFMPAYGRVELLPAYEDDAFGFYEVIGTSYWNPAQPLVRFRTGDLARVRKGVGAADLEAITLGLLPFEGVEGRRSEYLLSPEGARLIGINHIPRGVPDIVQMQIVQTALAKVEIHVVPLKGFGAQTVEIILGNARQKIPDNMEIDIRITDHLIRTSSGKTPLVLRQIG